MGRKSEACSSAKNVAIVVVEATILARALSQPLILGFMFEFLYVLPSLSLSEYFATAPE